MSIIRPRNRLVYFRVSEDEFLRFSQMCKSAGARSISDLARAAMEQAIRDGIRTEADEVAGRLKELNGLLTEVGSTLQRMNAMLAGRIQTEDGATQNGRSDDGEPSK